MVLPGAIMHGRHFGFCRTSQSKPRSNDGQQTDRPDQKVRQSSIHQLKVMTTDLFASLASSLFVATSATNGGYCLSSRPFLGLVCLSNSLSLRHCVNPASFPSALCFVATGARRTRETTQSINDARAPVSRRGEKQELFEASPQRSTPGISVYGKSICYFVCL